MILPGDSLNQNGRWQEVAAAAGREESQTSVENRKKQRLNFQLWLTGGLWGANNWQVAYYLRKG